MKSYSNEKINSILDYSKMLIDSINRGKDVPQDLKEMQYLIFAGMVSYYGQNHYKELYEAFQNINLVQVKGKVETALKKRCIRTEIIEKVRHVNPIAHLVQIASDDVVREMGTARRLILVSGDKKISPDKMIEAIIQEVNCVVNSMNNSYVRKGSQLYMRTGLALRPLYTVDANFSVLEGTINTLQTAEIMEHILNFTQYDINDPELREVISKINYQKDGQYEGLGYDLTVPLIKPLYDDVVFGELLKLSRLDGNIDAAYSEFDAKTSEGSFEQLSQACEFIGIGNCPDYVLEINGEKVKSLVKQYAFYK